MQARLGQLNQRLSKIASIDPSQIPTDRAGLGSKVVVEDEKTGVKESYFLVFGDALEFEEGHVTMSSPIGRALLGKAVGEVALLRLAGMAASAKGPGTQDHPRGGRDGESLARPAATAINAIAARGDGY